MRFDEQLGDKGGGYLLQLERLVQLADPHGRTAARSRLLCAGLGSLSEATYAALGGRGRRQQAGVCGAALSLLTKIDDEVIDGPAFHSCGERGSLAARTRAFLAPTLASIRAGAAANDEARCLLAADVGSRLRELAEDPAATGARLSALLAMIARGWAIQVEAVVVLSSRPEDVSLPRVAEVTRNISGAWLAMIAMIGAVTPQTRSLCRDEIEAIFDWGFHIQRADALADLQKDRGQGLHATWLGKLLSTAAGADIAGDEAAYRAVAAYGLDRRSVPAEADIAALGRRLARVRPLHEHLHWIHRFLVHRYVVHPLCRADAGFAARWRVDDSIWERELSRKEAPSCSVR